MTTRTVSILFLCVATALVTGVALALAIFVGQRRGVTTGPWLLPAIGFISAVVIFFMARNAVLPAHLASPPRRALIVLGAWIGGTILVATLVNWLVRPVTDAVGFEAAGPMIWLVCILSSGALLERCGVKRSRSARR